MRPRKASVCQTRGLVPSALCLPDSKKNSIVSRLRYFLRHSNASFSEFETRAKNPWYFFCSMIAASLKVIVVLSPRLVMFRKLATLF